MQVAAMTFVLHQQRHAQRLDIYAIVSALQANSSHDASQMKVDRPLSPALPHQAPAVWPSAARLQEETRRLLETRFRSYRHAPPGSLCMATPVRMPGTLSDRLPQALVHCRHGPLCCGLLTPSHRSNRAWHAPGLSVGWSVLPGRPFHKCLCTGACGQAPRQTCKFGCAVPCLGHMGQAQRLLTRVRQVSGPLVGATNTSTPIPALFSVCWLVQAHHTNVAPARGLWRSTAALQP